MIFMPPFSGFLRYLVSIDLSARILVTTNGNESVERPPSLIITYPNTDHWASLVNYDFGQYIQVELLHMKFKITNFSYENLRPDLCYSMNWQFLGSLNGEDWDILDEHIEDDILGTGSKIIFPVINGFYSFFRILHTGFNYYSGQPTSHPPSTILYVRNIDLFGTFYDFKRSIECESILLFHFHLIILVFILTLVHY